MKKDGGSSFFFLIEIKITAGTDLLSFTPINFYNLRNSNLEEVRVLQIIYLSNYNQDRQSLSDIHHET